ncbi:MAG: nucleotidyltransferase [Planctomycetota bacterium]|jgi:hypothetical protein
MRAPNWPKPGRTALTYGHCGTISNERLPNESADTKSHWIHGVSSRRRTPEGEETMSQTYIDLLTRLVKAQVRFVLIGGYACIVHGGTQTTEDVDVCCDFAPDNLLRLQQALANLNPVHRMTPQRLPLSITSENCQNLKNLYLDTDLGQLDCIGAVQGLGDFCQVEQLCQIIEVNQIHLKVLSRDALIQSKKAMDRPRDREAVRQLEAIKKMQADD